ncbi:MAG: hypothetical protein KAT43_04795 [Nanoarchaeota archaeon]|nr:hypothetical protein [Nanoarchaeota archaeon]
MLSESDEMDLAGGHIMQKTVNEFFDGNVVAYIKALWEWFDEVPGVWEPLPKFKLTEGYMLARNSRNPRGLSYAKSKETFPNSLTLVTRFYLYNQVSQGLPHVKAPRIVELLDMSNSRRFWRIVRKEERSDDPLEAKLERFSKKRLPADWEPPEEDNNKVMRQMIQGLAHKYLFDTTLRKLYIEYEMKGRTEKLEFLMEKYGILD